MTTRHSHILQIGLVGFILAACSGSSSSTRGLWADAGPIEAGPDSLIQGTQPASRCGDGVCRDDETCTTCAEDCGRCPAGCGDATCSDLETCASCPDDCGSCPSKPPDSCGDGVCRDGETCATCPEDCNMCPPTVETIPSSSPMGCTIAATPYDALHVACTESDGWDLLHARRLGNQWTSDLIWAEGSVGIRPSIATGANGDIAIVHSNLVAGDLLLSFRKGALWSNKTLLASKDFKGTKWGQQFSLAAFDGGGYVFAAADADPGGLTEVREFIGNNIPAQIADVTKVSAAAVALDPSKQLHIATCDDATSGEARIRVHARSGNDWTSSTVTSLSSCYGASVALGFNSAGTLYLGWTADTTSWLASRSSGNWTYEKLPSIARPLRMAVAQDGTVAVCHPSASHAICRVRKGGQWRTADLGSANAVSFPSVAVDSKGKFHVVFVGSAGKANYAELTP